MAIFTSRTTRPPSSLNQLVRKHPSLFGVPFLLLMVGASYGLTTFTQTRYDMHDKRVQNVTKEQELGLKQNRKKFDIREEYYRLSMAVDENWEQKRIARPKGLPEWGVPPTEPPPPASKSN